MRRHWEAESGRRTARVAVADGEVIVASNCGPAGEDVGAKVAHAEFLEGRYHRVIRKVFGQDVLDEIVDTVEALSDHDHADPA